MKRIVWSVIAITALSFVSGYAVSEISRATKTQEPGAAPESAEQPLTRRYALRNAAVADAAVQLAASLGATGPEIVTDIETNSFTTTALPQEHDCISRLLAVLDARPLTVQIQCSLARTDSAGQRTVLSRPLVRALDGTEALFSIGDSAGETIEVTLVPTVVLSKQEQAALVQASSKTGSLIR